MWGPAWVTWRSGGGWVGWAALPPRGVSVTTTYGHRSPWRFTRAADLGAKRLRCLPMRDTKGMFRRTTNVANDRVLTRGQATVHINAGPRYIPNAMPGAAEGGRAARVPAAGDPSPPGREHVGAPVDPRGARRQRAGPRRLPDWWRGRRRRRRPARPGAQRPRTRTRPDAAVAPSHVQSAAPPVRPGGRAAHLHTADARGRRAGRQHGAAHL